MTPRRIEHRRFGASVTVKLSRYSSDWRPLAVGLRESRAVIRWKDGSVCSTDWLPDDGSQKMLDQMVDDMVTILNQRLGETCAIKWEQRELAGLKPYLQRGIKARGRAESRRYPIAQMVGQEGV